MIYFIWPIKFIHDPLSRKQSNWQWATSMERSHYMNEYCNAYSIATSLKTVSLVEKLKNWYYKTTWVQKETKRQTEGFVCIRNIFKKENKELLINKMKLVHIMNEVNYMVPTILFACKWPYNSMIHFFNSGSKPRLIHGRKRQMVKIRSIK